MLSQFGAKAEFFIGGCFIKAKNIKLYRLLSNNVSRET